MSGPILAGDFARRWVDCRTRDRGEVEGNCSGLRSVVVVAGDEQRRWTGATPPTCRYQPAGLSLVLSGLRIWGSCLFVYLAELQRTIDWVDR